MPCSCAHPPDHSHGSPRPLKAGRKSTSMQALPLLRQSSMPGPGTLLPKSLLLAARLLRVLLPTSSMTMCAQRWACCAACHDTDIYCMPYDATTASPPLALRALLDGLALGVLRDCRCGLQADERISCLFWCIPCWPSLHRLSQV